MDKHRLSLLVFLVLAFVGATSLFFIRAWSEGQTRFRSGLPIPRNILPESMLTEAELNGGVPVAPAIRSTDPVLYGNASSPISLIVFGDLQSDLTRQQAEAIQVAIKSVDPKNQYIGVIWRDLPGAEHSKATIAAIAGRCANAQGKFKKMHDLILTEAETYDDLEFLRFARRASLDEPKFTLCVRDKANSFYLERDIEEAQNKSISKIPTIFINGEVLEGYTDAQTLIVTLRSAIRSLESAK